MRSVVTDARLLPAVLPVIAAVVLWATVGPTWLVMGLVALAGAGSGAAGIWLHRPAAPRPWVLLVASVALWAVGYLALAAGHELGWATGTWALLPHLAALGVLAAALGAFTTGARRDTLTTIDALIVVVGLGLVLLVAFVEDVLAGDGGVLPPWAVVGVCVGLLLVAARLSHVLAMPLHHGRASALLAGSVICLVAAEITVLAELVGSDAHRPGAGALVLLAAAHVLTGAAAQCRSMRALAAPDPTARVRPHPVQALVLGAAAAVGPAMIAWQVVAGQPLAIWEALGASALVIVLAAVRTSIMVNRLQAQADELERLADTDPVTGLGNRRRLVAALGDQLGWRGGPAALVLVEVERFTELRDVLGPQTSDELLLAVAGRLRSAAGPAAVITRLRAGLFGVLLPGPRSDAQAAAAAASLRATLASTVRLGVLHLEVRAACGVVRLSSGSGTAADVLASADLALAAGDPGDSHDRTVLGSVAADLARALERDELVVHFQPQVAVATGAVTGLEALVRWQHPEHGLLGPGAFIPAAERTGLIVPLTAYVLASALEQVAGWRRDGLEVSVAVNLSAHNLLDAALVPEVAAALARHGVPAAALELELTESVAMVDPARAVRTLTALDALGVAISVDDYGTGHSSLAYLGRLPVRRLKIDRSFVTGLHEDAASAAIVASTVDLARHLGLEVVAEGVEDLALMGTLRALGCHGAQGFALGRPVPAAEVPELVRSVASRLPAQKGGAS